MVPRGRNQMFKECEASAITIYHDPETDEFTVSAPDFDDYCTMNEQEAKDEADAMSSETGLPIVKV